MYFGQDYIMFHPVSLEQDYVYDFEGKTFEEFFIEAGDGEQLNAVIFKPDSSKSNGLVIYHHGNSGNIQACGWHYKEFTTRGYDCLIWDYRSYGKTPGPRSEEKFYSDALDVYDWATKSYDESNVVVYGSSLGTGFASYVAANRNPQQLILEAPYYSIEELGTKRYPIFPAFIVKYPLRTHLFFPKIKCPITLFHGTADQTIFWQSSERLAKLNPSATFVKLDGVGHNNISKQSEYQEVMSLIFGVAGQKD